MPYRSCPLAITTAGLLAFALAPAPAQPDRAAGKLPALKVAGDRIVGPDGQPVPLRGVNLGSWLAVESHFSGFAFRDEKSLWAGLERRLGRAAMERVREGYRAAWVTAEDFRRARDLGLNHVRVPFWAGLLEDDAHPGKYRDDGWKWLDAAVEWAERAGVYAVLDLHGAPGGQSTADHTGERDRNAVWADPALRRRTANLWAAIARRYKDRPAVAAFDLLNEPMGAPNVPALVAFQAELAQAVRRADPRRIVIVEDGFKGLDKLPAPAPRDRAGLVYSTHNYPTMGAKGPSPEAHERFFREGLPRWEREQARFKLPLYVGEWSVIQEAAGGGPMTRRHVTEMDRRGWSWALWIYKQANKDPVRECWSFYRNDKPIDMPDVTRDDAETLVKKFEQFRTERLVAYEPLRAALK
jgi:glucan 1,3-beta-glucosidase